MASIAIITARGGSKRIPKKNVKEFLGKPILNYSIEAALSSGAFDTVMVSTDSEEIADIARAAGAEVPFMRSEKTSNDFAVTYDVLEEVILTYKELGIEFDKGCCIYPTAPFVTAKKLKDAMDILEKEDADTVMAVVPFSFPPQRGLVIENGYAKMPYPQYLNTRSQDLDPMYHDCGQFYAFDVEQLLTQGKVIMEKTYPCIMPEMEVQDIDTFSDWEIAEMKYKFMLEKQNEQ